MRFLDILNLGNVKTDYSYHQTATACFKGSLTRDFRLQVFFINQCTPGPQVFHWSLFEFFSKIRGDIRELMFIAGVNDTAVKLFTGVNDAADKFFSGVNDTGGYRVLPILACQHLKMKNNEKFNL